MTPRTSAKGKAGGAKRPAFSTPFKKGFEGGVGTLFDVGGKGKGKEREVVGSARKETGKSRMEREREKFRKVFDLTRESFICSLRFSFLIDAWPMRNLGLVGWNVIAPEGRISMAAAYIRPEFYSPQELSDMDM